MNVDSDRLILALTLLLAGFIIVFVVLILLIAIITIYGKLIQAAQGASEKHKQKKKKVVVDAVEPPPAAAPVVFGDAAEDGEIPGEIIAVIAAAVDAVYGSSAHGRIRSVKRSRPARSAWGRAGVVDNTRPF